MTLANRLRPGGRSRSLTDDVVQLLTESIRGGEVQPGDKLPTEANIMAQYGVSRTVVREAISKLQAAGLVETRHGIGTFVAEPARDGVFRIDANGMLTVMDVIAMLELRISVEAEAARLAARRRDDEHLEQMREALLRFEQAQRANDGSSVAADVAFHQSIARATGNRYFVDMLEQLGTLIIPRARVNTAALARDTEQGYLERVRHEHEEIYRAIARADPEAAYAAMRMHLSNSRERLEEASRRARPA